MKYCQNCGATLDDNARFCIECGGVAQETENYSSPVDYSNVPLISNNTVLNTVRDCARSPFFLAAIILYTATILFNIVNLIQTMFVSSNIYNIPNVLFNVSEDVLVASNISAIIVVVIGSSPAILMAVGMWITYASARGNDERMSTSGLTIIKVISIIFLVLMCVAAGMMLLLFALMIVVISVTGLSEFTDPEIWAEFGSAAEAAVLAESVFVILLVVLIVLTAAIFTFAIIYYAKIIKTINVIKSTIETGTVTGKISTFVAVMAIIIGAFMAFPALYLLVMGQFIMVLSYLLSALSSIFFGVLLFSYKNKMASVSTQA